MTFMSDRIHELLHRNLQEVFGEGNGARRRAAIAELYAEDCVLEAPPGIFVGAGALDKFVPICSIEASTKIIAALKLIEAQRVARISPRRIPVARPNKTGRDPALTLRAYCHATEVDDANAATLIASIFQSL
jgi:hypothetical protein